MPFIRYHRPFRPIFRPRPKKPSKFPEKKAAFFLIVGIILIGLATIPISGFLKNLACNIALSDATDLITATINNKIHEKMSEGNYSYNYFVNLEKDEVGNITAISANMSRINTLSSEILQEVITATESGQLDLKIPVGNLLGSNMLLGRGPDIPIRIIMLTSSFADFRNDLASAGINQIKHQIILEVRVDIDVLMPWEIKSTQVLSEILIAETIIVGKVPETYLNLNTP